MKYFFFGPFEDDDFVEDYSLFGKTLFILASTTIARMKYYHAWLLADAICNASGLGFNGYTSTGKAKWDLISNVDIIKFEVRSIESVANATETSFCRFMIY